jgi:murein DD-endopeptidase MepM/ murein hydrolase activator NlpD
VFGVAAVIGRTASILGRIMSQGILFPIYRLLSAVRRRFDRLASPARNFAVSLLTNRYLFHIGVAAIAIATVAANLQARQVRAQDVGETSILYGLAADQSNRSTVEPGSADALVRDSRYTGDASLVAAANIDFDYGDIVGSEDVIPPSLPDTLAPSTLIPNPEEAAQPSAAPRTETETYAVKDGDTLAVIARRFGVTVATILWANGRTATQYIRPGDQLRIPPVSGVLVTVKKGDTLNALASKYGSSVAEIVEANRLDAEKTLPVGAEIVLPGGEPPEAVPVSIPRNVASRPTSGSYPESGRREPIPNITQKPADADASRTSVGKLFWPTSGHVVTQYYGWRHTGLDVDGDFSSPLYAAHDGVVTTAGWNSGGYGLQIVVTGSGVMTRYAHASKIFVKVGDVVKKGQTIAMMGSTGRSTGSHLHFEVYVNGVRTNPLTYLK